MISVWDTCHFSMTDGNVGVAKPNTEVKNAKRLAVPTWRGLDAKRLRVGYVVHYGGASKPHYIVRTHRVDGSDLGPSRCVEVESITSSSFSWQCAAACVYTHTHSKVETWSYAPFIFRRFIIIFLLCVCHSGRRRKEACVSGYKAKVMSVAWSTEAVSNETEKQPGNKPRNY